MREICADAGFILGIIAQIVKIIRWAIPILLILLVTFDLVKVVATNPDEKTKKEALGKVVKRVLYAVIILLVPSILNIVLLQIEPITRDSNGNVTKTSTSYLGCWNMYYNK